MAALNYAKEYGRELAQAYPYALYFGDLWAATKPEVKFVNNKTIEIPSLSTTGRVDGDRDSIGTFSRNFDNTWETKTLSNHRTWGTLVHPRDIDETNQVASIANITKVFNEEQKFPEMNAYAISRMYELKNGQEAVTSLAKGTLTKDNVLTYFDTLMDVMDEKGVPSIGRILYVDTYTKTLIDTAKESARYLSATDEEVKRRLSRIDEVTIKSVPTKFMKTAYTFFKGNESSGQNNGYAVAKDVYVASTDQSVQTGKTYYTKSGDNYTVVSDPTGNPSTSSYYEKTVEGAKNIKMFLVHLSAVIPAINYEFAQLESPSALSQGKYVYFEESFEDLFIYDKKHDGIQFVVENA